MMGLAWSDSLNGALLLDKPDGISSAGALNKLKGMLRSYGLRSRDLPKIGHGGTLDPFATGLLVVLVGHGTSLASHRLKDDKVYEGTIVFGEKTSSGDTETEVCERGIIPSFEDIEAKAKSMEGAYDQVPPMFSAKKIDGKRLYELARKGREVERAPVPCRLSQFSIYRTDHPHEVKFKVSCSSGTFIRTLAEDLANGLGTVAHLRTLDRLASGSFQKRGAFTIEDFQRMTERKEDWTESGAFLGLKELLKDWPLFLIQPAEEPFLIQGRLDILQDLLADRQEEKMALIGKDGVLGLAHRKEEGWAFLRMFSR
mgnify:CR=1 FL=1